MNAVQCNIEKSISYNFTRLPVPPFITTIPTINYSMLILIMENGII